MPPDGATGEPERSDDGNLPAPDDQTGAYFLGVPSATAPPSNRLIPAGRWQRPRWLGGTTIDDTMGAGLEAAQPGVPGTRELLPATVTWPEPQPRPDAPVAAAVVAAEPATAPGNKVLLPATITWPQPQPQPQPDAPVVAAVVAVDPAEPATAPGNKVLLPATITWPQPEPQSEADAPIAAAVVAVGPAAPATREPLPATITWPQPQPQPDAPVVAAVVAVDPAGPATAPAIESLPAVVTWSRAEFEAPWTPPVAAGVTWPDRLSVDAWPVAEPGLRPTGTWVSPGYRSSARWGTSLGRALGATTVLLTAAGAGMVAVEVLPRGSAAEVDLVALTRAGVAVAAVLLLVTVLAGIGWLRRSMANVPPLTGRTPWLSPRQAAGLSVLPGFHAVIPWIAVEDLAVRVCPAGQAPARRLVRASAALSLVAQGLALIAILVQPAPRPVAAAALLTGAVAAVLLMLVVRRLEGRAMRVAIVLGLGAPSGRRWPAFPEPAPADDGAAAIPRKRRRQPAKPTPA